MSGLMTIPSELSTAVTRRLLSRKYYANVVNVPKPYAINPLKTILLIMRPIAANRIFHLSNEHLYCVVWPKID